MTMAFPGTYNINYYEGDTYEFKIYPKDSTGATFDLTGYSVKFFIATATGPSGTQFECLATIGPDSVVSCTIPPGVGRTLVAGTPYFYDVEVTKAGSPTKVYTLLAGSISVTADVTGAV